MVPFSEPPSKQGTEPEDRRSNERNKNKNDFSDAKENSRTLL